MSPALLGALLVKPALLLGAGAIITGLLGRMSAAAVASAPEISGSTLPATVGLIVWLTGVALLAARRVGSAVILRRLLRSGHTGSSPTLETQVKEHGPFRRQPE